MNDRAALDMAAPPRRALRSVWAVLAGLFAVTGLSLGVDQVLHLLEIYPPWGEPMHETSLNLLALSYRVVIGVLGGYVTARLAPQNPMRHAIILGCIGLAVSIAGAVATIPMNIGPAWYPIVLALTALPCSWLGGALHRR